MLIIFLSKFWFVSLKKDKMSNFQYKKLLLLVFRLNHWNNVGRSLFADKSAAWKVFILILSNSNRSLLEWNNCLWLFSCFIQGENYLNFENVGRQSRTYNGHNGSLFLSPPIFPQNHVKQLLSSYLWCWQRDVCCSITHLLPSPPFFSLSLIVPLPLISQYV